MRKRNNNNFVPPDLSCCIVWAPLHPITLVFPFIGHLAISDSQAQISDFQGNYYVHTGITGMMTGPPTRYIKIDIGTLPGGAERWDEAIQEANQVYCERIHNICCDNCHSHVCNALNRMHLEAFGIKKWDMVKVAALMFLKGRFVSVGGFLCQFLPFCICIIIIILNRYVF